ncbi:MAG TPA: hypothetical protein VHB48_18170 [Chitinophagaceae bacterium]|nr:hypothetical protein [Chitinophagaceae bacterium]
MRSYIWGGAGKGGIADRFGPPLNFSLILSFLSGEKKVKGKS